MKMKNQYKQRQRQIEKSIKNDYNQNGNYYYDMIYKGLNNSRKEVKPKLVMVNGKLTKVYKHYENGVPSVWDDII